jgi:redox-sensitive bicupin YhaK (pirin superfamily)
MEILTYVLDGEISHRDGEGNASTLEHGRVQLMSAGRGIVHSEHNASADHELHLLQIWIEPERAGLDPAYQEASFELVPGRLEPLATPGGEVGGLAIQQSARVYALRLAAGQAFGYAIADDRHVYLQAARGAGSCNGIAFEAGDGAALSDERSFELEAGDDGLELLVFDLA